MFYKTIKHDQLYKKTTTNINGYMLMEQTDPDSCMLFKLQISRQKKHRMPSQ